MELSWSLSECLPITHYWSIFSLMTNHIFSYNTYSDTCRSNILLSTSINYCIFIPINRFAAETRAHITYYWHISHHFKWKFLELYTMNSFIITIVEVGTFLLNIPCRWIRKGCEFVSWIRPYFNSCAKLLCFSDSALWPCSWGKIACLGLFFEHVIRNSWKLKRSSSLEEENFKVFRYTH